MGIEIFYTKTDEAPAAATVSLLPIIEKILTLANIKIKVKDISLAARIIAVFSDVFDPSQKRTDALNELAELVKNPDVNIIKLPNISASVPQLKAAIKELKECGYRLPDYPENPSSNEERVIKEKYSKILGSAVNPVLREGNSDRRVATAIKEFARENPHYMGEWTNSSKTHVASMKEGDFYSTEKSLIMPNADTIKIELQDKKGNVTILKEKLELQTSEIIDVAVMSKASLCKFFEEQIENAKQSNVLFSLHLKATMMKISDPIIFGHAVKIFYKDIFQKYGKLLREINVDPNNGIGELYSKIESLSDPQKKEIKTSIQKIYEIRPRLAMVNPEKGITNLHSPNNVIIDASMPAAIRFSGKMQNADGDYEEIKAVIPDRSYAGVYQKTIDFCKKNGAFDVAAMGNVSNIGLMAQKAEEYGSHDKTFEVPKDGSIRVISSSGKLLIEHKVKKGDIWRMCQTKDLPVKDWVNLAVERAKKTGSPLIFWLDENRAHDRNIIKKLKSYLKECDLSGIKIEIMSPVAATEYTLKRLKEGKDTISATGNILRDYLTDLFPILELGSSSKMLSIVPLLAGGKLYETGAGGTAPDLFNFFLEKNHLGWDSLGEFLALSACLEDLGEKTNNKKIKILAKTLDEANTKLLKNNKSPSRELHELDNRGSHFYIILYWAEALAEQTEDEILKKSFTVIAKQLKEKEKEIIQELNALQGTPVDIGGYYQFNTEKITNAMRPNITFNNIIESIGK